MWEANSSASSSTRRLGCIDGAYPSEVMAGNHGPSKSVMSLANNQTFIQFEDFPAMFEFPPEGTRHHLGGSQLVPGFPLGSVQDRKPGWDEFGWESWEIVLRDVGQNI